MKKFFRVILLALIFSLSSCTWFAEADCTKLGQLACSHTYEWRIKDPTCQSGGYTAQSCTKCGYTLESTKKDVTPIRDHTPLNRCGFCGMDYFQDFTEAFMARETVQHYPHENRWYESNVFASNDLSYQLELEYVEQTEPVFTVAIKSTFSYRVHVVTIAFKNASGIYDYSYVAGEVRCEGHLIAENTTDELANFDVTSSNMEEGAQILCNDIINEYSLAMIDILANNYFPPHLPFTLKHFGFENV